MLPLEVCALKRWLLRHAPADVIVPLVAGQKRPAVRHRNGGWSWSAFDALEAGSCVGVDFGVLLREIVVIDVDSRALAAQLESEFPALASAPCVRTRRGAHYWFRQATEAVVDARSPRVRGVDIKALCSTGTAGVVAVPPSGGRRWVRRLPKNGELTALPADVAEALARPPVLGADIEARASPAFLCVRCADGCELLLSRAVLADIDYFRPIVQEESLGGGGVVPAPVNAADLIDIVAVLGSTVAEARFARAPTPDVMASVRRAADMIGATEFEARLGVERVAGQVWMAAASAAAWEAWARQDRWRCASPADAPPEAILVDLSHCGLPMCDSRLDPGLAGAVLVRRALHPPADFAVSPGAAARVAGALPALVLEFLREFRAHAVVAGGFVAGAAVDRARAGGDIDIFVHSCEPERGREMEARFRAAFRVLCVTRNAVTAAVDCEGGAPTGLTVQLVRRLYADRARVVAGFDIAACQVMARLGAGGSVVVEATPEFVQAARTMSFYVNFGAWGPASARRVLKYIAKGFTALAPGIDRARATAAARQRRLWERAGAGRSGARNRPVDVLDLLAAEHAVLAGDCSLEAAALAVRGPACGYGDLSLAGRAAHAVRAAIERVQRVMWRGSVAEAAGVAWGGVHPCLEAGSAFERSDARVAQYRLRMALP